ncbi:MAG: LexA family protein [Candidatus Anammoxibacter sp.]
MKQKIIECIKKHVKEKGYAPSQATIGRELGLTRAGIHFHFHQMESELIGYNEYKPYFDKAVK